MKNFTTTILITLTLLLSVTFGFGQQVMISQYFEPASGHADKKGIEIYNYSGQDIVFSPTNNLIVYKGLNGAPCVLLPGTEITSGTLEAGKVWVIGKPNLTAFAIANGTELSGTTDFGFSFNGDDALQVYLGGVLQDVFGECGVDPGTHWTGSGGGNGNVSTINNNISLRPDVCKGSLVNWTDPSLRFDDGPNGSTMTGFGTAPVLNTSTYVAGAWDTVPDATRNIIFDDNYTTGNDVEACSCTVNAGKTVTVTAGKFLNIVNYVKNDGTIVVEHEGSLVQQNDKAAVIGTDFQIQKTTTPYVEYDFTYWSSPVVSADLHTVFADNIIGTSSRIFDFDTTAFLDTDSNSYDDAAPYDWNVASGAMTPAKGYIAMGSQYDWPFVANSYTTGLTQDVSFDGKINNGVITIPVVVATTQNANFTNDNLIGNPYPSAIDGELFLNHADNTELTSTLYFWTHATPLTNTPNGSAANDDEAFNFTNNDYATFTIAGFAASASGSTPPSGKEIASGQGFFAPIDVAGSITFDNSMRVTTGNDNFLRPEAPRDRVWINMTGENGLFRQVLVGFFNNATTGYDRAIDGKRMFSGHQNVDFYTVLNNERYAIQGLPLITNETVVPFGINAPNTAQFTISIDRFEGDLDNVNIYVKDNVLNTYHNLKTADFQLDVAQTGEINDRYDFVFSRSALSTRDTDLVDDASLVISNQQDQISFKISHGKTIIAIEGYDVLGKLIVQDNTVNSDVYSMDTTLENGTIVIFKVTLDNGQTLSKKFVKL